MRLSSPRSISVGGEESGQLLRLLGQGGLLMTFGALANQPMIVSPGDLIFKQATIRGFWTAKLGSGPHRAEIPRAISGFVRLAGRRRPETDCRTSLPPRGGRGSRPRQCSARENGQDRASGVKGSWRSAALYGHASNDVDAGGDATRAAFR